MNKTTHTILISTATYLVLEFFFWLPVWLILPILWVSLGYASIKIMEWVQEKMFSRKISLDRAEKIVAIILGPIVGVIAFLSDGLKYVNWPQWLPKIRNPFFWSEKEVDNKETTN